jgi:ubiquitin-protein ligase
MPQNDDQEICRSQPQSEGDVLVKLGVLDCAGVCLETAMQIGAPLRLLLADNLTPGPDEIADSQPRQLIHSPSIHVAQQSEALRCKCLDIEKCCRHSSISSSCQHFRWDPNTDPERPTSTHTMSIPLEHDSVPTKAEEMSISPFTQHHQSHYGSLLSYIKESGGKVVKEHDAKYRRGSSAKLGPIYRIYRELRSIHQDKTLAYISVEPIDGALDNCLVSIEGPPGSPYAGGVFWPHLVFPPNYPNMPFNLRFITPIYHPNICSDGTICHNMFNTGWSPVQTSEKDSCRLWLSWTHRILRMPWLLVLRNTHIKRTIQPISNVHVSIRKSMLMV